jgi:hypothetical protein
VQHKDRRRKLSVQLGKRDFFRIYELGLTFEGRRLDGHLIRLWYVHLPYEEQIFLTEKRKEIKFLVFFI